MLKEVVKIGFLLAAGMVVYDINKAGAFVNSDAYKFLKENGVVDFAQLFMAQLKVVFNRAIKYAQIDTQADRDDMCLDVQAYVDLFCDMLLVCKNSIVSAFENSSQSFNKNFPTAVDDVSILVSGALTSTKEGLLTISSHVQNIILTAVNYGNEMLRT